MPSAPASRTSRGRPGGTWTIASRGSVSPGAGVEQQRQVQAERRQQRKRPRDVDRERRQHRQHRVAEERAERRAAARRRARPRRRAGCRAPASAGSSSSIVSVVERVHERVRALGDRRRAAAPASGPARSGVVSPSSIALLEAGDPHHEELVEVRRGDRRELDPLEQRRRRVGRLLEHALVEREPRQLAVDEQRAVVGAARPSCTTPARADHELPAEHLGEHVGARRRRQPLHREVARAVELEDPRCVRARTSRRSLTFCRCSASSALATRRIAASLLTISRSCAIERDVRQVALLRQAAAVVARDVRRRSPCRRRTGRRSATPPGGTASACGARAG